MLCRICNYGGDMRWGANCLLSALTDKIPQLEAAEFVHDIGCDVLPKIIKALQTLDVNDEASIVKSRKLFNEATGKIILITADYINLFKKLEIIFEIYECIDDKLGLNKLSSASDWSKCGINLDDPVVLGYCGIAGCKTSQICNIQVNIKEHSKVYLLFRVADAWAFAGVQGSLTDLEIGSFK